MACKITKLSREHFDHGLNESQVAFVAAKVADICDPFFKLTFELPPELGTVLCGLIGPASGGVAVPEDQVFYAIRGDRKIASRLVARKPIETRIVSAIGGADPDDPELETGQVRVYTAFGGPHACREPGDPSIGMDFTPDGLRAKTPADAWKEIVWERDFWAPPPKGQGHALVASSAEIAAHEMRLAAKGAK